MTAVSILQLLPKTAKITNGEIHYRNKDLLQLPKKEIQKLIDDLELSDEDVCNNVIDTGVEWEVFDIVNIV